MIAEWELIYYHFLPGRGDFVRLLFEEAGVPYTDVCRNAGNSSEAWKYRRSEVPNVLPMFPPIVRRGDFILNQTTAILHYLGKEFGLYPTGGLKAAHQIKKFREVKMPAYLEKFEKQLSQNFRGAGFFI